jgi:hypothetical protein
MKLGSLKYHTAEVLVPGSSYSEVEIVIVNIKHCKIFRYRFHFNWIILSRRQGIEIRETETCSFYFQ